MASMHRPRIVFTHRASGLRSLTVMRLSWNLSLAGRAGHRGTVFAVPLSQPARGRVR